MASTPYARLLVALDGGAAQAGAVEATAGSSIQLFYESTVGWPTSPAPYVEIYEYPEGWAPDPDTGWVVRGVTWRYYGTTPPPAFAAPALATWGKVKMQLVVGGGLKAGRLSSDMVSQATLLVRSEVAGLESIAWREDGDFDWRGWVGAVQRDLRLIETKLAEGGTGGIEGVTATDPLDVDVTDPANPVVKWLPQSDVDFDDNGLAKVATITSTADLECLPGSSSAVIVSCTGLTTTRMAKIRARNTTAATNLATVQNGPVVSSEGYAWRTSSGGASIDARGGFMAVPVSGSSVQVRIYPVYDIGSGWQLGGEYYTTQDPYLFGFGRVQDTLILTVGGSGVRWADAGNPGLRRNGNHVQFTAGGTNNVSLATNATDRLVVDGSTADITKSFNASSSEIEDWGTAGVNRSITTKRVITTTDATTTNVYTYSMADNSALCWEIKVYCYQTGNPSFRAHFHRYAYFNRNGGAPTKDEEQPIAADKVIGGWGTPPQVAITGGAPTTNDVSVQVTGLAATSIKWLVRIKPLDVMTTAA